MNLLRLRRRLDAGRAATVRELRALAEHLEQLPLDQAAETLTWIEPRLDDVRRAIRTVARG